MNAASSDNNGPTPAARFVVGIDLGTTNSAVAYADATGGRESEASGAIRVFPLAQLVAAGAVEELPLLPSFLYLPIAGEFADGALRLPWSGSEDLVVGEFARKRGAEVPARMVASAKSWLSHAGVDRTAPILPWGAGDDVPRISPLAASTRYLEHVRLAWDGAFRDAPLAEQDVLLTVPASFDPVARELTVRAAQAAGLPHVTVIEEPQAAFYAWIDAMGDEWRRAVRVGDVVLVCDIGGGTTDFTLIAVNEEEGRLRPERIAVGDHVLLGGDNMDLALAYRVRERLAQQKTMLDEWQFRGLTAGCREAKEKLLGDAKAEKHAVAILGRGRKVIGGSLRAEVLRDDVREALVEGFFPRGPLSDRPRAQRRAALREVGLPYAEDAAITRQLAGFLGRHGADGAARPSAVLFNGGVMRGQVLRERLVDVLQEWFAEAGGVRMLAGGDPEFAVARGAAYYGLARRGRGVRIRGGTARAFYVGIESAMPAVPGMRPPIKALCVAPRGVEEGSDIELPAQEFNLVVGEPTEFRFLGSATRGDDVVGTLVEAWDDDITELPALETTLEAPGEEGTVLPVRLQARVSEVGVLELWCVSRDGGRRWKLEFNVRGTAASAGR